MVLKAAEHDDGKKSKRLALLPRLQIGGDCQLADVVGVAAQHVLESCMRHLQASVVERDQIARDLTIQEHCSRRIPRNVRP